jgi:hypothetical protein
MKNIHVLPKNIFKQLGVDHYGKTPTQIKIAEFLISKHIYITNDEEIKKDYVFAYGVVIKVMMFDEKKLYFVNGTKAKREDCKKIILTTDQDLIKDGVQPIDDEFLEWLVKNRSCEMVQTIYGLFNPMGRQVDPMNLGQNHSQCVWKYKIIIPKEEPKQETLEEAAERYAHNYFNMHETNNYKALKQGYEAGAKEMAERMYSEAIKFGKWLDENIQQREYYPMSTMTMEELFKQFKKK